MAIIKTETPGKIYWNGYTQQLKELYYLLFSGKYITCGSDEFMFHFTGKKWKRTHHKIYKGKLTWNKGVYLLILLVQHLVEKKFLEHTYSNFGANKLKIHFKGISPSAWQQYSKYKNQPAAKRLQRKLDLLFPVNTGYRCKERRYYLLRNRESEYEILKSVESMFK